MQCINHVNGCPLFIVREKLISHLERCPASVVYCTMEWNRWPVYSHERQSRVPFLSDNLHAQYGQLDVALALRDQRMLNAALKAPRSTRRVLRNNLTQRFPAVPIRLNSTSGPDLPLSDSFQSESEESMNFGVSPNCGSPNEQSTSDDSYKVKQKTPVTLKEALKTATGSETGSDDIDVPNEETEDSVMNGIENSLCCDNNGNHPETPLKNGDIGGDHIVSSETDEHSVGPNGTEVPGEGPVISPESQMESEELTVFPNPAVEIPQPPCPAPLLFLKETLALDLNLECITRYHAKPRSMYTFLCAQEFRRDEYSSHCKNVHDEIYGGLNGWLEQRCPLAHYGCTYSMRRFYPTEKGSEVIHNTILESFGVKPKIPAELFDKVTKPHPGKYDVGGSPPPLVKDFINSGTKTSKSPLKFSLSNGNDSQVINEDSGKEHDLISTQTHDKIPFIDVEVPAKPDFNSLPFEVLRHIVSFLDGHSLCNVAITSKLLRDVTCSILEEKGIVIHQWGKRVKDGQTHWEISHKVSSSCYL